MKRLEIGGFTMLTLILVVCSYASIFGSQGAASGVVSGCGSKLKVPIIGLPNQNGNASAIVSGQIVGSSYHFANSSISIPGVGVGRVILGLHGNPPSEYSILIEGLSSETHHTPLFATSIPKEEVCVSSLSNLSHSPPGYIYIPGIGFGEWELTQQP
jgi:hypothetical protein